MNISYTIEPHRKGFRARVIVRWMQSMPRGEVQLERVLKNQRTELAAQLAAEIEVQRIAHEIVLPVLTKEGYR